MHDNATGLHNALCRVFRSSTDAERLEVLIAHPDLAGKLAAARRLTAASTAEQAGAGLDALTDSERTDFVKMNSNYVKKHGFPFEARTANDQAIEFNEACHQVERIAELRLRDLLPR